jgi:hypothetical protein
MFLQNLGFFCKMGSIHGNFLTSLGLIWGTAHCQRLVSKVKACQQGLGVLLCWNNNN